MLYSRVLGAKGRGACALMRRPSANHRSTENGGADFATLTCSLSGSELVRDPRRWNPPWRERVVFLAGRSRMEDAQVPSKGDHQCCRRGRISELDDFELTDFPLLCECFLLHSKRCHAPSEVLHWLNAMHLTLPLKEAHALVTVSTEHWFP